MKKTLLVIGGIIVFIYAIFQFFFKERYTDVLHTKVDLKEFSADIKGIENMIKWYSDNYHIPAISAAVIEQGRVVKNISIGTQSKKNKIPVDENSIYRIASTGKLIIALIAHQVEDEGLIDLDKSINDYLGELIKQSAKEKLKPIKIRNLLLHNSGLGRDWKAFSESDIIEHLNNRKLDFRPGEKWSYSNFGYVTMTLILEKATGLTYTELLKKYITDKYEIDEISTTLSKEQEGRYVIPYFPELKILKGEDLDFGKQTLTSGIYTNTKSLSKLMIQQIAFYQQEDSIKSNSPYILNKEKINAWSDNSYYGHGIFEHHFELENLKGKRHIFLEHGGDADGFACSYGFFPEYRCGIIILTSSGGKWFLDMGKNLNNLLINKYHKEN